MTQLGCTKMSISRLFSAAAGSILAGRKSKCYFIIKVGLLLSIRLCRREIRPDTVKTTENEFVASFLQNDYPGKRDSDKTLVLLINRHVCLVVLSFTNTLV